MHFVRVPNWGGLVPYEVFRRSIFDQLSAQRAIWSRSSEDQSAIQVDSHGRDVGGDTKGRPGQATRLAATSGSKRCLTRWRGEPSAGSRWSVRASSYCRYSY